MPGLKLANELPALATPKTGRIRNADHGCKTGTSSGPGRSACPLEDQRPGHAADPVDTDAAGRARTRQNRSTDEVGLREGHLLGHEPTEGEPEEVDPARAKGTENRDRVVGHLGHGAWHLSPRDADPAVIEGDNRLAQARPSAMRGSKLSRFAPQWLSSTTGTPPEGPSCRSPKVVPAAATLRFGASDHRNGVVAGPRTAMVMRLPPRTPR
jgi:hypothetical protein